ncbi:Acetyltransferase (GNAT) domain-containing protein [Brevibacterium iodinum ATCC 49514]|uniref:Acetyltransferase (GNAT) domain-containing protein n=2 Tax=Brevibacterium iodinum TaxID=31943 RepID=A0A2H1JKE8_9MICO|nr:Acetyltransferase (GNAT) domain-containing protein [Brevibacterium iodinum ATCC 49514]SUW14052.1 Uncharacterised protein [Brevibacterium iodinum]
MTAGDAHLAEHSGSSTHIGPPGYPELMRPCDTPRLRLREMTDDDLDDMAALLGDLQVMEYYPHPKDRTEAAAACVDHARELGMQRNPELRHKSPSHEVFSLDL